MALDLKRITPVDSTMATSVSYNYALETMVVTFVHGAVYEYHDVPADVYRLVLNADSLGKAYNAMVKGKYPSKKLNDEPEKQTSPKRTRTSTTNT